MRTYRRLHWPNLYLHKLTILPNHFREFYSVSFSGVGISWNAVWLWSPALCSHPSTSDPPPRSLSFSLPSLRFAPGCSPLCVTAVQTLGKGRRAYQVDTQGPVERETWGAALIRPRGEGRISQKSSDVCVYLGSDRSTGSVCGEGQANLTVSPYLACLIRKPILPQLPQTYLLNELNCLPVC